MQTSRKRPKAGRAPTWMRTPPLVYGQSSALVLGVALLVFGLVRHHPAPFLAGAMMVVVAAAFLAIAYLGLKRAAIYAGVAVLTLTALVSAAVLLFTIAYLLFQHQEVRA